MASAKDLQMIPKTPGNSYKIINVTKVTHHVISIQFVTRAVLLLTLPYLFQSDRIIFVEEKEKLLSDSSYQFLSHKLEE